MIICLGTTPALQRTMIFNRLNLSTVNRAVEMVESASGKSVNVAKVLTALGEDTLAMGFLGGSRGECVQRELERLGVRHEFVNVEPETRMCITVVDRGGDTHTELVEESRAVGPAAWEALVSGLKRRLPEAKMLAMSGTLVPQSPAGFYGECTRMASAAGVPVAVDATGEALAAALPHGPALVKPNRGELGATTGMPVGTDEEVREAMRRLMEMGARMAVTTLGPAGAIATDGARWWRVHSPRIRAVSTIGSGDSVTAGIISGLIHGKHLGEATRLGVACGAANALTLMSGEVHREDVDRLIGEVRVERMEG